MQLPVRILAILAAVVAVALVATLPGSDGGGPPSQAGSTSSTDGSDAAGGPGTAESTAADVPVDVPGPLAAPRMRRVVAISVDGMRPSVIGQLGRTGTPSLHRMIDEGATTLEARTAVEQTVTLPNHTGMLTGRRIETRQGHGVDVNEDPGGTVSSNAGRRVESVYSTLARRDRSGHLYTGKEKFALFRRSWPAGIARYVHIEGSTGRLMDQARRDLVKRPRPFSFVHLAIPDVMGHAHGWGSDEYLDAVRYVDQVVGELMDTIESRPRLRDRTTVLLTSDHGGAGLGHYDNRARFNYRVAFMAWGAQVRQGADLYRINPSYRNPRESRPGYAGPQPIRNAAIGNLALDLLGVRAIPGSRIDDEQDLRVR
ncbi:alkaline phosphatase family protein [Nocardioides sp. CFH 31398]|uniref:alkaline phosphatase family protein n=1 Tax=Nocardioides sp. CFH 31398 TaxID=2919579 RepID=UPI001F06EC47|nr:alkaline phosphatase family protein [Nocardioides sp. CFH 31398]MCH1867163.1 alkaline phosphatase family protein [Nocardioides sp. CFH 31398]